MNLLPTSQESLYTVFEVQKMLNETFRFLVTKTFLRCSVAFVEFQLFDDLSYIGKSAHELYTNLLTVVMGEVKYQENGLYTDELKYEDYAISIDGGSLNLIGYHHSLAFVTYRYKFKFQGTLKEIQTKHPEYFL